MVTGEKTRITILKSTRMQIGDCGRPGDTIDDILIKLVELYKKRRTGSVKTLPYDSHRHHFDCHRRAQLKGFCNVCWEWTATVFDVPISPYDPSRGASR